MLAEISFPIPLRRTFYYQLPDELELKAAPGLRVLAPLGKRAGAAGMILRVLPEKDADLTGLKELKSVTTLLDEEPLFPEGAVELAAWMSARWGSPHGLCLGAFYAHAPKEPAGAAAAAGALPPAAAPRLPELEKLRAALSSGTRRSCLLRLSPFERPGPVYAGLFEAALRPPGSQGLLVVPDLSFISALQEALEPVFPGQVGAWHARLTPKRRAEAWAGAASGRFRVMIATRTGVFLPFRDLRLAALDSEHEDVYRQEEAEPFYHAREVLLKRAEAAGASAVLASPCPSVESWGAASAGGLERFDAVPRARMQGPGPDVRVIDLAAYPGDVLARPLTDGILRAVKAGAQALVIAARKGYASRLFCANCGWMPRCRACGPGLTVLKAAGADRALLCRRCGKREPWPAACPACGGKVFRDYGAGTQKAQEAIARLLPDARIARFDGDVLRGSLKAMNSELEAFARGEADVLVGTRIALRDLGAPRLSLAAFIDADSDLSSADFRASEKAYRSFFAAWRLLGPRGELLIQTRETGHNVFSRLTEMDYPSFADGELAARRDFFYPPFSHIVKVRLASFDRGALDAAAADLLKALSFLGSGGARGEILGPVTPQGQEKRKFHSEYYLVKAAAQKDAAACLAGAQSLRPRPGVKYFIEADPYGFQ